MTTLNQALCVGILLLAAILPAQATSADEPTFSPGHDYRPVGAPADPKVDIRWNRYYDYAEATEILERLAKEHPERARLESLGRSHQGRELWLLTITSFEKGDDRHKPALWMDGGIHGNEIQATEVCLYAAWYLLELYGQNTRITALVDDRTFYIMPMVNPDGRDAHMHAPNTTHTPRGGLAPHDADRDGLFDEDGYDDLDGDGHITQMRIRDPDGRHKPHPEFPDLMIPAEPDEPGQYRLLGWEGYDRDGDGRINEDPPGSYDMNRDFAWDWQPAYVQRGAYRYPFAHPETRAMADFVMARPNIAAAQTLHNTGGMFLRGPGARDARYEAEDVRVLDALGARGEAMIPGYRYLVLVDDLYEVHGGEIDWFYYMQGVYTFTIELFTPYNYFHERPEGWRGRPEEQHRFSEYLLFGDGLVPWREVDHPQFGRIEVGGLKKTWGRQPPSFMLEEECHRNAAFALYHAEQMPQVKVRAVETRPMAGGLTEVTAVVANTRLTPTRSAIDLRHEITPPDVVRIEGERIEVVAGLWADEPFFRQGHEQPLDSQEMRIERIRGMTAVYVRWIVRGGGPVSVTVESTKGGRARREVGL